ncbi:proline rich [Cystoisospora suis]|uniref:Proline rich n=1 Tax=Cystoisospora suis TaxID=483139 RepID=A0A2C6L7H7_9APIC|nr:proline rich [Cystoisospora suis]
MDSFKSMQQASPAIASIGGPPPSFGPSGCALSVPSTCPRISGSHLMPCVVSHQSSSFIPTTSTGASNSWQSSVLTSNCSYPVGPPITHVERCPSVISTPALSRRSSVTDEEEKPCVVSSEDKNRLERTGDTTGDSSEPVEPAAISTCLVATSQSGPRDNIDMAENCSFSFGSSYHRASSLTRGREDTRDGRAREHSSLSRSRDSPSRRERGLRREDGRSRFSKYSDDVGRRMHRTRSMSGEGLSGYGDKRWSTRVGGKGRREDSRDVVDSCSSRDGYSTDHHRRRAGAVSHSSRSRGREEHTYRRHRRDGVSYSHRSRSRSPEGGRASSGRRRGDEERSRGAERRDRSKWYRTEGSSPHASSRRHEDSRKESDIGGEGEGDRGRAGRRCEKLEEDELSTREEQGNPRLRDPYSVDSSEPSRHHEENDTCQGGGPGDPQTRGGSTARSPPCTAAPSAPSMNLVFTSGSTTVALSPSSCPASEHRSPPPSSTPSSGPSHLILRPRAASGGPPPGSHFRTASPSPERDTEPGAPEPIQGVEDEAEFLVLSPNQVYTVKASEMQQQGVMGGLVGIRGIGQAQGGRLDIVPGHPHPRPQQQHMQHQLSPLRQENPGFFEPPGSLRPFPSPGGTPGGAFLSSNSGMPVPSNSLRPPPHHPFSSHPPSGAPGPFRPFLRPPPAPSGGGPPSGHPGYCHPRMPFPPRAPPPPQSDSETPPRPPVNPGLRPHHLYPSGQVPFPPNSSGVRPPHPTRAGGIPPPPASKPTYFNEHRGGLGPRSRPPWPPQREPAASSFVPGGGPVDAAAPSPGGRGGNGESFLEFSNPRAGNGPSAGGLPFSQQDGGGGSGAGEGTLPVVLRMSGVPGALLTYDNILSFCSMYGQVESVELSTGPDQTARVTFLDRLAAEEAGSAASRAFESPDLVVEIISKPRGSFPSASSAASLSSSAAVTSMPGGDLRPRWPPPVFDVQLGAHKFESASYLEKKKRMEELQKQKERCEQKKQELLVKLTASLKQAIAQLTDPKTPDSEKEAIRNMIQTIKEKISLLSSEGSKSKDEEEARLEERLKKLQAEAVARGLNPNVVLRQAAAQNPYKLDFRTTYVKCTGAPVEGIRDRDAFAEWVFSQPDALLTDAIELVSLEVDEEGRGFGCLKYLTRQTAEQVIRNQANQPFTLEWMDPPLSDVPPSEAFLGPSSDGANHMGEAVQEEGMEGERCANGDFDSAGNAEGTQRLVDEEGTPGSYAATPDDPGNQQSHNSGGKPMLGAAGSREGGKSFEGGAHHHDTEVDYDFE